MNSDPAELNDDHDPWPPVRGDYVVGNPGAGVAVVTLASQLHIRGAAIVGPCKTENLGVEKIVANIISNVNIRFLLICGAESKGICPATRSRPSIRMESTDRAGSSDPMAPSPSSRTCRRRR